MTDRPRCPSAPKKHSISGTQWDSLSRIIEMACLTEDRTKQEQNDLLYWAHKVDEKMNELTTANKRLPNGPLSELTKIKWSYLERHVMATLPEPSVEVESI